MSRRCVLPRPGPRLRGRGRRLHQPLEPAPHGGVAIASLDERHQENLLLVRRLVHSFCQARLHMYVAESMAKFGEP